VTDAPNIPYLFYGGNREAILCREPEVILAGPAETGKTLALLYKLHLLAYKYPGCQLAILRKKKVDLLPSILRTFKRDILENYGPGVTHYGGEYPQWYDYLNGSRIWLGGLDDPGKTLSAERDVVAVCQTEELSVSDWEYLTRVTTGRGAVMPYTQLMGDCNPSSHTHWILSRTRAGKITKFDTTHKDNPTLWDHERCEWTTQGKRTLARLSAMTGTRLLRLYHGLWAAPEGAIYDVFEADLGEYGQKRHVVKSFPIPAMWPRAVGIDPFGAQIAAVWLAFDPNNGILNVYREYMQPFGLTVAGHAQNIKAETADESVFAWVCGAKSERAWRTEWTAAGIPVIEPPISDVWVGIDKVYQLLSEFRLVFHDCCTNLISEAGDYRRKMGRDGTAQETIENKDTYHVLDSLRYVVVWLMEPKEITEVARLPWMRIA